MVTAKRVASLLIGAFICIGRPAVAEEAKVSVAPFPLEVKAPADAKQWQPLEADLRSAAATLPADRFTVMAPDAEAKALSSAGAGKLTLDKCGGAMMSGMCGVMMGAGAVIGGSVFLDGKTNVLVVQATKVPEGREIFVEVFEGDSPEAVRQSFKDAAPKLFARFTAPPRQPSKPPAKAAPGKWHALRVADASSPKLQKCDKDLANAVGEKGFVRSGVIMGVSIEMLTKNVKSQQEAAEKMEPCAKAYGPMYHVAPVLAPGTPVTRQALLTRQMLSAEQCADLRDRIGEMHDQAKMPDDSDKAGQEAAFMSMMTLQMFTGLLQSCP
jgi:hypothetical protein